MGIREQVQDEMKTAMKQKEAVRLECLRMVKGALLLKEKETGKALPEEEAVAVLRGEVRKRRQSLEIFQEHGQAKAGAEAEAEIAIIESFLPAQLTAEQVEEKVRAYVAEHPEVNHAGKLTGMMKKELGDQADGRVLNEVCRKVLGG